MRVEHNFRLAQRITSPRLHRTRMILGLRTDSENSYMWNGTKIATILTLGACVGLVTIRGSVLIGFGEIRARLRGRDDAIHPRLSALSLSVALMLWIDGSGVGLVNPRGECSAHLRSIDLTSGGEA